MPLTETLKIVYYHVNILLTFYFVSRLVLIICMQINQYMYMDSCLTPQIELQVPYNGIIHAGKCHGKKVQFFLKMR